MKIEVHITCDNAAFANGDASQELARMFTVLAEKLGNMGTEAPSDVKLYDVNGNPVGFFKVLP